MPSDIRRRKDHSASPARSNADAASGGNQELLYNSRKKDINPQEFQKLVQLQAEQRRKVLARHERRAWILATVLTFISLLTRFWALDKPSEVVFDEVHFGKFASYYMQGTFYFDVHPPLGKMMLAAVGKLAGYKGDYLFDKIGEDYLTKNVPYVTMRALPALLGALLVPVVFLILYKTKHSLTASTLGAFMVLMDTSLLTHSRLILLDAFLLFFDIATVFTWVMFYHQSFNEPRAFTFKWWLWLSLTGVLLACATSVKMVGLFAVALIGSATIQDLWRLLDIRRGVPLDDVLMHFVCRSMTLIILPFVVYLAFFGIHFSILHKSGPGDNFMTPQFQATLDGNRLNRPSESIYYGANVTFLHYKISNYLHSHVHRYPLRYDDGRVSSQGQQVTGYPHSDYNNIWIIIPLDGNYEETIDGKTGPRFWRHKDEFYLQHFATGKRLLTHDVASPLTPTNQEVTCVNATERVPETVWRVELTDDKDLDKPIHSIDSKIRLVHNVTGVGLHMHKGKYGTWGFEQFEVNGNKHSSDKTNTWIVDSVSGDKGSFVVRTGTELASNRHGFFSKWAELQSIMLNENSRLVASHPFQSSPSTWPIMHRGISFWVKKPDAQIYFVGNPIVWAVCLISLGLHVAVILVDQIFLRRGMDEIGYECRRKLVFTGGFFLVGWAFHYLPFFIMGRALFIHHYLPALIYSILAFANFFDFLFAFRPKARHITALVLMALCAWAFITFAPFSYGYPLSRDQIQARQWLSSWDFSLSK